LKINHCYNKLRHLQLELLHIAKYIIVRLLYIVRVFPDYISSTKPSIELSSVVHKPGNIPVNSSAVETLLLIAFANKSYHNIINS